LRIIPDIPRRANTPATLKINHFPLLNQSALTPHNVIITPANTIRRKETINIVVVIICINHPINIGKASFSVTSTVFQSLGGEYFKLSQVLFIRIQLPMKGTLVFSFIHPFTHFFLLSSRAIQG